MPTSYPGNPVVATPASPPATSLLVEGDAGVATTYHSSIPRRSLILIAFIAFISLGLPDGVLGVAWPSVQRTFDLPVSYLAMLVSASTCGYLVSSFSSGSVVPRLGVGKVLLFSSMLMVCASTGYAIAPVWPVMVMVGFFVGLGSGSVDAALNAYAAHHFTPRVMNWMHAFYGVGATLGPLLMTGVLSAGLVWRWGYALNATLLALMSLCFLLTLKLWQTPVVGPAHEPVGATTTIRRPVVMLSVFLFFIYAGMEVSAGQWMYTLFTKSRGVAPAVAGVWIGIYWASLTAGRVFFGTVAAHLAPLTLVRIVSCIAPIAAGMIWVNVSPALNFAGLALLGFCFAPMFPTLVSLTPGRVGAAAGHQVIGFEMSAACLGAAGIAGLTGVLARRVDLEAIGVVLVIGNILVLVVHETLTWISKQDVVATQASQLQ